MKDVREIEAELIAERLVVNLAKYRNELVVKSKLSQSEARDQKRINEVIAVLNRKGEKVMHTQKGYGEWLAIVGTAILSYGVGLGLLLTTSGCVPGYEVGGKLGVYRVDERSDSSSMNAAPLPWKCYFMPCGTVTAQPIGKGE